MTPADARALRRRKVAELRAAEPDLSLRQMAERLGLSRDTVTRDLDEIGRRAAESAPPAGRPVAAVAGVAVETAPPLPVRAPDLLAGIDVSGSRALRRDLAILAQSGQRAEALVHQAVVALAHQYRQDLAAGRLKPGQRFLVRSVDLRLAPAAARTAAAEPPAAGA
ncbi:HTH domain-containing protein [Streptomyces sp. NPDC101455]|uniref:HTH domain-containing protein n=1 Tax=Streptomyces sp. NPDC101455 TaxID=3366142 RepID=UPI0038211F85